jgi:hypothetical protein
MLGSRHHRLDQGLHFERRWRAHVFCIVLAGVCCSTMPTLLRGLRPVPIQSKFVFQFFFESINLCVFCLDLDIVDFWLHLKFANKLPA